MAFPNGTVTPDGSIMRGWGDRQSRARSLGIVALSIALLSAAACSSESAKSGGSSTTVAADQPLKVTWMPGFAAPGTPDKYNQVGVIKIGPANARNVIVLEPGTSAGAAYFVPLAQWIISKAPGWQVWSVERRGNLLEDQSELDAFKQGTADPQQLFDYYLGYLKNPAVKQHFEIISPPSVAFAKQWGMNVAVQDLRVVINAATTLGGKVVLGGHSLGGSVVTAYATWDFGGTAGAFGLAGLAYIDGSSSPTPVDAATATMALQSLDADSASPWLSFGGIGAPYAGVFNATGSLAALKNPDEASLGQASGLLPADLVPKVAVTNAGQYGYALDSATSPQSLAAAQAHLGTGLATTGATRGWDGTGALTPLDRYATMFSGAGIAGADGTEWYFPQRLTNDTRVVANGNANPGQEVLGLHATMGDKLPKGLLIVAFGAQLGGSGVLDATHRLAEQSGIPAANLTLIDRHGTYAHNDPAGAFPNNEFVDSLVPMLTKLGLG